MPKILIVRPPSKAFDKNIHLREHDVPFMLKYIESLIAHEGRYHVKFIDCFVNDLTWVALIEEVVNFSPEILIISTTICDRSFILKYVGEMKKSLQKMTVIAAGQDSTLYPENYVFNSSPFNFAALGECELAVMDLLKAIECNLGDNKISGIYSNSYQDKIILEVDNLEKLPFPVYTEKELKRYRLFYPIRVNHKARWGQILTSRGCKNKCIFCTQTIRQTYGTKIRLRKPESIIKEIKYLMQMGVNVVHFADDNFSNSYKHIESICKAILDNKVKIKWSAQARIDEIYKALLVLMRKSGCVHLRFGIESGSEKILISLRKTDNPANWLKQAGVIFSEARKLAIDTVALLMLGNPDETKEDINKTIKLVFQLKPDFIQLHFFTPYPGSDFYEENSKVIANQIDASQLYHYRPPQLLFSNIRDTDLLSIKRKFYNDFYCNSGNMVNNLSKFLPFYINNPNASLLLLKELAKTLI